ncbi:universal stress protein [Humitalea sp. 24SJ18S-53]|uniref:universal stress protein n=1 Tax=Humitalea sp. 24SJ18S-53 TaxID=3422307 RepID=UPI003D66A974
MICSILVALDDTPGAESARDLALALARATKASVTAAVILDLPHAAAAMEPVPLGGAAFKERRDAARVARVEKEAAAAIEAFSNAADGTRFETLRLADAPEPALRAASAGFDLLVIGRDSTLGLEENSDGLSPTIAALLHHGARPLLVVPPCVMLRTEGPVLLGYDGSIPCLRALQLYALLRPMGDATVTVVSVGTSAAAAQAMAEVAAGYLRRHGIPAEAFGSSGDHPADVLLAQAAALHARMLVIGAYETSGLRALLLGSATRKLLIEAPCPVFVSH